jgi:teichoic acid transport system ATP-binding protein
VAGNADSDIPGDGIVEKWPRDKIWKTSMTQNPGVQEYGDRRAEILDYGLMNERGEITSMITKGETFTVLYRFRLNERIENPIFAFTIRDMKGSELCGTNTMYEDQTIEKAQAGLTGVVRFTQRMTLQGGQYMLALGLTGFIGGELHAYHRLYDVCDVEVLSDRNTVGIFDMESKVEYDDVMVIREEK